MAERQALPQLSLQRQRPTPEPHSQEGTTPPRSGAGPVVDGSVEGRERQRHHVAVGDVDPRLQAARPGVEVRQQRRLVSRQRRELEGDLGDDAEGAQAPDVEPGHVVATDVFHHPSAALDDCAVGLDDLHAYDQVPKIPILPFRWAAGGRRQRATDGGATGHGRIDSQELAVLRQHLLEIVDHGAGLDGHGEVGGVVLHDSIEAGEVDHLVEPVGTVPYVDAGAAAPGADGQSLLPRGGHELAELRYALGEEDYAWVESVDGVV